MKQVWKRRAVAAAVVVLVGTSVYLNWRYAGDVADTSKVLGQSTLVNGETAEAQADTADSGGDDYFSTARLSRKQARDTAISMLEEAKGEENASEEVANEASETLRSWRGIQWRRRRSRIWWWPRGTPTVWPSWVRIPSAWWCRLPMDWKRQT